MTPSNQQKLDLDYTSQQANNRYVYPVFELLMQGIGGIN